MKEESIESLNKYLFSENERLNAIIDELEEKIDKAIEYIKDLYDVRFTDKDKRKLLEILGDKELDEESKDEKYETYTLIEDEENGTKQINGEWYRVEKK